MNSSLIMRINGLEGGVSQKTPMEAHILILKFTNWESHPTARKTTFCSVNASTASNRVFNSLGA